MNIFYLDEKPMTAARMHCDKHVVKMILESAQMLSTAHRILDGNDYADRRGLYKATHKLFFGKSLNCLSIFIYLHTKYLKFRMY